MSKALEHFDLVRVSAAEFQPLENLIGKGFRESTYETARCLFASLLKSSVVSSKLSLAEITEVAKSQTLNFCDVFGGQSFYVSKDLSAKSGSRDSASELHQGEAQSQQVEACRAIDALPICQAEKSDLKPLADILGAERETFTYLIARFFFILLSKSPVVSKHLNPTQIAEVAISQVRNICSIFGGHNLYVTKEKTSKNATRNESIQREFNGKNISSLAMKHQLSTVQIRNILGMSRPKPKALH